METKNKSRKKLHPVQEFENGKLQPQAVEMEEAVLGAVLLEQDAFDTIASITKPEHFYKEENGIIYKSVQAVAARHEPIDILSVVQELKRQGNLEIVGGSYYVSSMTNRVASSANIENHARIVAQMYYKREMILIGTQIVKSAYEDSTDCFDLIDDSISKISNILNDIESKQAKSLGELKDQVLHNCAEALNNKLPSGIPISHSILQKHTNGWQKGHLIILGGRPGMGKTVGALEYAIFPALQNIAVAIFSLEMTALELTGRLMSRESHIVSQRINNNTVSKDELSAIIKDTMSFDKIPLYIDDSPSLSITRLRSKAHRLKREKNIQLIIIDYLQLMEGANDRETREQEISKISRGLKKLARELELPVIALSQLSRSVESRPGSGKRPQLSDLRDSGSIEQDADMVIFYYRPEYYGIDVDENNQSTRNMLIKIIAKFRGGNPGDIDAKFYGETMRITDCTPQNVTIVDYSEPRNELNSGRDIQFNNNVNFLNE